MTSRWKEGIRALHQSLFTLTADERKMLCLILALVLLGLGAKAWHGHRQAELRLQTDAEAGNK
jgi:hypothetical protein